MNTIDRADSYLTKALAQMEGGFATKSAQKDTMAKLNRSYGELRGAIHGTVIATYRPEDESESAWNAYVAKLNEYELPLDLHQLRERHIEKTAELSAEISEKMAALVELRAEAKDMEVKPAAPKAQKSEYEVKVEKTLKEEMERLETQYLRAVDLARIFNGVPVSANSHMVTNQFGTTFVRTFYFMDGKLTRLNLIIAAAEQVAKEKGLI